MRKYRVLALLLTTAMLLTLPVWAGAMKDWDGQYATGAIAASEGSPIIVEHENLIFDIQGFPNNQYHVDDKTQHTDGFVTAEYTFHNPTEDAVTLRTLFPFGIMPSYRDNMDFSRTDTAASLSKYSVRVNGETVEATLRHSYFAPYQDSFDLQELRPRLIDGWAEDPLFDPEMTITKYSYEVLGGDRLFEETSLDPRDWVEVSCSADSAQTRIYLDRTLQMSGTSENLILGTEYRMGEYGEEGRLFFLYVVGAPLNEAPVWTVMTVDNKTKTPVDVPVKLVGTEEVLLKELLCQNWNPESEVSQSDWYNAVLYQIRSSNTALAGLGTREVLDVSDSLMRWYEYELNFEPDQRLVYAVTGVIYPSIDMDPDPYKYEYAYLLSLDQAWGSSGKLDITVNTPFHMSNYSPEGFEKTDTGYRLTLDQMPDGELKFTLCASKNPKSTTPNVEDHYNAMINPMIWFLVPVVVFVLAFACVRRKQQ